MTDRDRNKSGQGVEEPGSKGKGPQAPGSRRGTTGSSSSGKDGKNASRRLNEGGPRRDQKEQSSGDSRKPVSGSLGSSHSSGADLDEFDQDEEE